MKKVVKNYVLQDSVTWLCDSCNAEISSLNQCLGGPNYKAATLTMPIRDRDFGDTLTIQSDRRVAEGFPGAEEFAMCKRCVGIELIKQS